MAGGQCIVFPEVRNPITIGIVCYLTFASIFSLYNAAILIRMP